MNLKLANLPYGTNRNRTVRRDGSTEQVNLDDVEALFRRFWKVWRSHRRREQETIASAADEFAVGGT